MKLAALRSIFGRLEPVGRPSWERPVAEPFQQILNGLPWAVFLFFYVPLIYWSGFALKAISVLDYPSFYLAARLAFVDRLTPYGFGALDDYSIALDRWLPPFVYPPPSLLAFWPLTAFSLQNAFIVFTIISHLCLLGSIWLILRKLVPHPEQRYLRTLALCVSLMYISWSDAIPATLNLGQINIIAGFFVCLFLTALVEDKPAWRIAAPLCIAVLLKTYPVLLLILLVVRRRLPAAALTIVFYAAFVVVAVLVLPADVWTSWRTEVLPAGVASSDKVTLFSHSNVSFIWNQSIAGFFTQLLGDTKHPHTALFHPWLAAQLAHLVSALLIVATAVLAFRAWGRESRLRPALDDIAAFLLMVYLVAPLSWDHHLVFILPAALLALARILNGDVRGKGAVVLGVALSLIAWRMNLDAELFSKPLWNLLALLKFYSVMTLWVFFARRLYKAGSRSSFRLPVVSHSLQPQV